MKNLSVLLAVLVGGYCFASAYKAGPRVFFQTAIAAVAQGGEFNRR